eukprot:TRINITY_DN38417_c0_g1_i1.p1 TRINITY_DN38417_c0_g1~~TRINITY_DN38417_c0_g1_i1.p1  ORF type:complete len:1389 (+),score=197.49 TRINITY_DN38417_c0_g1_i1:273-4439(+)
MGIIWSGSNARVLRRRHGELGQSLQNVAGNGFPVVSLDGGSGRDADVLARAAPEDTANFLSRLLFVYVFPVMWRGYKSGRTDFEDLPPMPSADDAAFLEATARREWQERATTSTRGGFPPLLFSVFVQLSRGLFVKAVLFHALTLSLSYSQPILLHMILKRLEGSQVDGDGSGNMGAFVLAVAMAFSVMGTWIFGEYNWCLYIRCDLRWQVAMNHLTFRKGLDLALGSSEYTHGDLQNHFSTDASKVVSNVFHYCHAALLEAAVSIIFVTWNLISLIGSAGVVAFVVLLLFTPLQMLISRIIKKAVRQVQLCRDKRSRCCSQFFSAMRVVKCFCLEDAAFEEISAVRDEELRAQWRRRRLFPLNNFFAATSTVFSLVAAFAWLVVVLDRPLVPSTAFSVLAWQNILKGVISQVPGAVNNIIDVSVSLQRIQRLLLTGRGNRWLDQAPAVTHGRSHSSSLAAGYSDETLRLTEDVVLRNCDLGFPCDNGGEHRGVRGLSLAVRKGELLLVCGPIGCGKTTLLEGLAGALEPITGHCDVAVGVSRAYIAQRPWLVNGTLLDNVLFGMQLDADKLERAVECCALAPDIRSLHGGLEALVGEEGVQLSGGQKQRVSLARAVYSGAELVLLDDVLSALDAHVGRHVWDTCICKALQGRTRVLVTHQVQYCSHAAVSRILVLGSDGSLKHFGSFKELVAQGVDFGSVVEAGVNNASRGRAAESETVSVSDTKQTADVAATPRSSVFVGEQATESRSVGGIRRMDILMFIRAGGGAKRVAVIGVLIVGYYGSSLASRLELANWANSNLATADEGGHRVESSSTNHLVWYLILCLLTGMSCFTFFFVIQLVSLQASRNLHNMLQRSLLLTHLRFFDLTPTGRLLNRCLKDMSVIDDSMIAAFRFVFESLMEFIVSLIILMSFAWQALIVLPPFAVAYYIILNIYRWPARDLKRLEAVSRSPAMSHFADTIRGASSVYAYRHEGRFMRHNLSLCSNTQRIGYWFWVSQAWVSMAQEVLGAVFLGVIASVVVYRASRGSLTLGQAGLALSYSLSMPRDLMWLSRRLASLEVEFVSMERIAEYVRLPREEDAHEDAAGAPSGNSVRSAPQHQLAICADNVWFRYHPDMPWVLCGLTLDIPVGARAAIVGRTGCGKSSLLGALMRLYPVSASAGGLWVHGRDVLRTPLLALRRTLRVLLQDPIFFAGTIRSNLLCKPATSLVQTAEEEEEALWKAVRQAGLEQRLRALPNGLSERVEESGQNFSQGERQLLCLARVLLDDVPPTSCGSALAQSRGITHVAELSVMGPRILLCDEPTAACDLDTDQRIHETLLHGLPVDWTLAVVCHRLHRIKEFGLAFVVEDGRVAEAGRPSELLSSAGGAGSHGGSQLLLKMCQQQGTH